MSQARPSLPAILAQWAAEAPADVFLEHVDGRQATAGTVAENALRWAGAWRHWGVGPGQTVLLMLPNCFEAIEAWLGLAWLRAVEVPVNTAYRGSMLRHVIENSGAGILLVDAGFVDRVAELARDGSGLGKLRRVVCFGQGATAGLPGEVVDDAERRRMLAAVAPDLDAARRDAPQPHDIATVLYTSGTTGPSKGALVPWAQIHASCTAPFPPGSLGARDAFYVPFPLFHVSGKYPVYLMAVVRGRAVLRERFSTGAFWADVRRHGCTTTLLMESMTRFLEREPERPDDGDTPLEKVQITPMFPGVDAFARRFGLRVCTVYNMSEISCPIGTGFALAGLSCGRLRPGWQARIVDELDRDVPPGGMGELILRSDEPWTISAGYLNNPEATVKAWRNLWFHTGDAFTCDAQGNDTFVDRLKDAIRRRGENISSMELEAEVAAHPAVAECAAVAVASEWGEDDVKVFVVPAPGTELDPAGLVEFLRPRVPAFMLPRYVEVCGELPRTQTGKVRKVELRALGPGPGTWDAERHAPGQHAKERAQ